MKKIVSLFLLLVIFIKIDYAQADALILRKSKRQQVCEELEKQAKKTCEELMCQDALVNGQKCLKDGDFAEGMQICVYDSELPEIIKNYNLNHPAKKLNCDNF